MSETRHGTQRGAQAAKTPKTKGKNFRKNSFSRPKAISKLLLFCFALLSLAAGLALLLVNKPDQSDIAAVIDDGAMFEGISINGIDISGLNYSQARSAVLPSVGEMLNSIQIDIVHGTSLWALTAADLQPVSNLNQALQQALMLGRSGTVIENAQIKEELKANGKDIAIFFTPNEQALRERLSDIGAALDSAPVEPHAKAVATAAGPEFAFVEGKDGYMLNEDALYQSVADILQGGQLKAKLTPELEFTTPANTLEDIKNQTKLIATFQTSFGGSRAARNEKRVGNIQKACTLLNGMVVEDKTEFNFNGYIGPRTEAGGWPLAPGIVNGNQYEDQAGGGICQVSTTLYNALLCANARMERGSSLDDILSQGLEGISITERKHHSWPSSYADTGLDSTVTGTVEDGKSLNFVNNTGYPIFVFAICDQVAYTVTVHIYGAPLPDGVTYQVRGVVDEVIEPGETIIHYDTTKPVDYSVVDITARKGYKATAYRDMYINGILQPDSTETLYSETYRAVTGEKTVGTGGAPAPTPAA